MAINITADLEKAVREAVDLRKIKPVELDKIAKSVIFEMKDNISGGISPISGRRFPAYKNPPSYPGDRKPQRPVNLDLTGEFLDNLSYRVFQGSKPRIEVGFYDYKSIKKEQGHRDGANGQPKRPIIPTGSETFSRRLLNQFDKTVSRILKNALT